jgi:hypothetical protein
MSKIQFIHYFIVVSVDCVDVVDVDLFCCSLVDVVDVDLFCCSLVDVVDVMDDFFL